LAIADFEPPPEFKPPFEEVFERYRTPVYRFCLLQVGNRAVAEDLASDALVSAYRAYSTTDVHGDRIRVWLFRIARNAVIDHWRREKRRRLTMHLFGRSHEDVQDAEETAARNAELEAAIALLQRMGDRDRKLISLRAAAGLSHREIGEILNMSEHATAVAVNRALDRFAKARREADG